MALRMTTYNVLNYSAGREAQFRTVLQETNADVLVVQEILSQAAVDNFLNLVLDDIQPGEWAAGPFVNGPDTDNAIFYKPGKSALLSHYVIGTALRDIDEWTLRPVGYASDNTNVRVYAVHLKASQGSDNEQKRLAEVMAMRERMETFPAGQNYMVVGDFNIYTSSEPAYQYLLGMAAGPAGVVEDPIDAPGDWHDTASLAWVHTQSTRTDQFGGGATGGMDDRFDMILVGPALLNEEALAVVENTYTPFGNDGLHFNRAIIDPPENTVVSPEVAQALHDASDHVPVFLDLQLPAVLVTEVSIGFGSVIVGAPATEEMTVANGAEPPADELDYSFSAPSGFYAPAGSFVAEAGAPENVHVIGMSAETAGVMVGDLVLTTDAPDGLTCLVALSGTVLDHGAPSVEPGAIVTATTLDFGIHAPDSFTDLPAVVYNVDYGPLQALVEIYDAELIGDARFEIAGGFSPATAGETPASWDVHFDAAGAEDGVYSATLTFCTRDQQDLSGAIDLADLVFDLVATVASEAVDVALAPVVPARLGFISVSPNPYKPFTAIRYGVGSAGPVRITIYDLHGRQVRDLFSGVQPRGDHTVVWDGRDLRGWELAAGTYFVRLTVGHVTETHKVVRLP